MTEYLTHQRLNKKFQNNFDLTNFAIKSSEQAIADGAPKSLGDILVELENLPDIEKNEQDVSYA